MGRIDPGTILSQLNDKQREAVQVTAGPLLIIAGPGSGKTRALTSRIAYLIATRTAYPSQILALTFTNKAAREMRARIEKLVAKSAGRGPTMGTFHSVMARMLRVELRQGWLRGYTQDFSIYDTQDTERVLRQLIQREGISVKDLKPGLARTIISKQKNRQISPERFKERIRSPMDRLVAQIYGPYQKALHASNALDFDDLLLKPLELFLQHPQVLKKYQRKWRYVHIDEYQDTNLVQYQLSHLIAREHRNICVVGDDAQSIYAFRGADLRNILNFQQHYPEAQVVRLEQNYRSTKKIVSLADVVIQKNVKQLQKRLWTANDSGDDIQVVFASDQGTEAEVAVRSVQHHARTHGYGFNDCAVLYRTNAQSRVLEAEFSQAGIPVRIVGGMAFYQRREVKDALAYLRLLVNRDDDASFVRIINYPPRGIGLKSQEKIRDYAALHGISLFSACEQSGALSVAPRLRTALARFLVLIQAHRERLLDEPAHEVAKSLLTEANLFVALEKEEYGPEKPRTQNVQELISAIAQYAVDSPNGTLSTFLQSVALLTDADEGDDEQERVTLMTLHASKGLEFKMVFVGGVDDGIMPSYFAVVSGNPDEIEEERRLFYVGVTRAEKHLYLSWADSRFRNGNIFDSGPSQFLYELEEGGVLELPDRPNHKEIHADGGGHVRRTGRGSRLGFTYGAQSVSGVAASRGNGGTKGSAGIRPGSYVEHRVFGTGRVVSVSGTGRDATAHVLFDAGFYKRLRLEFAKLRVIS